MTWSPRGKGVLVICVAVVGVTPTVGLLIQGVLFRFSSKSVGPMGLPIGRSRLDDRLFPAGHVCR